MMRPPSCAARLALLLSVLVFSSECRAGSAGLDVSFGGKGWVTNDFGQIDEGKGLAIQPDGKIVVAGSAATANGTPDFAVARYNPDGTPDTAFGGTGRIVTDIAGGSDTGNSVAIQSDGKIVVGGHAEVGPYQVFALVRYNADGSFDTSFNGTGKVTTPIGGYDDYGRSVAIQADGKIILAGSSYDSNGRLNFALVRYHTNGVIDDTFGSGGIVITSIGGEDDLWSVIIGDGGKVIAGGAAYNASGNLDFALARYTAAGVLDTSFNGTGIVITDFSGGTDIGYSLTEQSDRKIIVAGSSSTPDGDSDFALARFDQSGALDPSFNLSGRVTTNVRGDDTARGVVVLSGGMIIAAGSSYTGENIISDFKGNLDFTLVRYLANGSTDSTFHHAMGNNDDSANGLALQSDGKAVAVGTTWDGANSNFAVARYNSTGFHVTGPASQTVSQGTAVTLGLVVTGVNPLNIQWKKDGVPLAGATSATFLIPSAQPWHAGNYLAEINNGATISVNAGATLKINPCPFNVWQGLLAYYPMNAALPGHDFGPAGLDAADQGTAVASDLWGRTDGARRFVAGESDGMATADGTLFRSSASFTWSAWVKTSGTYGGTTSRIISAEGPDESSQPGFALYANSNGKFGAGLNWGGGNQAFETTAAYPANVWRHLAATYDGSRVRLYVDGVLAGNRLYTGVIQTSDSPLYFGKYRSALSGATAGYFDGWLDEVRFYNRVLTAADLAQLRASDDGIDLDNDGLGDAWEARYGFSAAANEGAGDADGDGMTNREEYLAGSNPMDAASNFSAPQLNDVPGLNVLNLTWSGSPARNYAVQMSPELTSWQTLATLPGLTGLSSLVVEPPVRPVRQFFKVVVVP